MHQLQNKDIGMGYGTLVSLVFHNLPSLYPSSFCRNDFLYLYTVVAQWATAPEREHKDVGNGQL